MSPRCIPNYFSPCVAFVLLLFFIFLFFFHRYCRSSRCDKRIGNIRTGSDIFARNLLSYGNRTTDRRGTTAPVTTNKANPWRFIRDVRSNLISVQRATNKESFIFSSLFETRYPRENFTDFGPTGATGKACSFISIFPLMAGLRAKDMHTCIYVCTYT